MDYFNQALYDYSGLTLAHLQKEGWAGLVHPDDVEETIQKWLQALATGRYPLQSLTLSEPGFEGFAGFWD